MRQRSLRVRLLTTFGFGAFALSGLFASFTYVGVHHVLVSEKIHNDLKQAYVNAALVRSTLYTSPPDLANLLNSIERATNSNVLVQTHHQWLSRSHGASTNDVPASFVNTVIHQQATFQMLVIQGQVILVVGVPIPSVETQFFEVFHLGPLEDTLRSVLITLTGGALITSLIGVGGGLWVTRRAVRPLEDVSRTAVAIAGGAFTTRLAVPQADREVQRLTESFNEMVERLVERMQRDARFASDVSHELRSPLTSLRAATSVLLQHRDELSSTGRESLDLLVSDVSVFQSLVEDLLEMARGDAGAVPLVLERVPAIELVRQCVRSASRRHGLAEPPIEVSLISHSLWVEVDRRRFERVMANLIDNAHRYANAVRAVRVTTSEGELVIDVDDAGPGVLAEEREEIFERFFRGRVAHDRSQSRGTGLGLALVREHLRAVNGTIRVLESPEGGARFEILLPLVEEAP